MAAIMVLVSGWVGLAFAILGQIFTEATFGQFFTTWIQVGFAALLAFAIFAVLRRAFSLRFTERA